MVNVHLKNVFVEHKKKALRDPSFGKKNGRWFAAVALELIDKDSNQKLAEWFYLIACSKAYLRHPFKKGPILNDSYLVVQDEFDFDDVLKVAKQKMAKIRANDWDEFYQQMEEEFLHEN